MSFETSKFDLLYGKLLGKGLTPSLSKQLASTLYRLSQNIDVSIDDIVRNVTTNGIRFDNVIYASLNRYRSNSSQVGYLDINNIPLGISQQIPTIAESSYIAPGYVKKGYVE